VLCCVVLWYIVSDVRLRCVMLCRVSVGVLCRVVLFPVVLCCVRLYCVVVVRCVALYAGVS